MKEKASKDGPEIKTYYVSIPIAGAVTFAVQASNRKTAIAETWKRIDNGVEGDMTWEYYEQLVEGNCLHADQNLIEVSTSRSVVEEGEEESP